MASHSPNISFKVFAQCKVTLIWALWSCANFLVGNSLNCGDAKESGTEHAILTKGKLVGYINQRCLPPQCNSVITTFLLSCKATLRQRQLLELQNYLNLHTMTPKYAREMPSGFTNRIERVAIVGVS